MALANPNTLGVEPAKMDNEGIPEIGVALDKVLSPHADIHFGINVDRWRNRGLYQRLDLEKERDKELVGAGPRIIDIKRRGGRIAEDDWVIAMARYGGREESRSVGLLGMTDEVFTNFNEKISIKEGGTKYRPGAKYGGRDLEEMEKGYEDDATTKADFPHPGSYQFGTRWSKTALEHSLACGGGNIHFHLDGMGDLAGIFGERKGNHAYNATGRELRYVRRYWNRFQHKVIFYNGYKGGPGQEQAVIVCPPWIPKWEPDDKADRCRRCNAAFTLLRRRHHCRLCGEVVCSGCCAAERVRLTFPVQRPGEPRETGPVIVCDVCWRGFSRNSPASF